MKEYEPYADENGNLYWPDEERDWVETLRAEGPTLNLLEIFTVASKDQRIKLERKQFESRLLWCLNKLGLEPLPEKIVADLHNRAVRDLQQMAAFVAYCKGLESDRFKQSFAFVKQERARVKKLRHLLGKPGRIDCPRPLNEWTDAWLGSVVELLALIEAQLVSAERDLNRQADWLSSGRTKIESHLLSLTYSRIKELVDGTAFSRRPIYVLAAYAHAALLVRYSENEDDGYFVQAIKMRVFRSSKSVKRVNQLSLFLMQLSKSTESNED